MAEIEFDPELYSPLPAYKPIATRPQIEKALALLVRAERPVIVAGGGVINADAAALLATICGNHPCPGDPDPDGLGLYTGRPRTDGREWSAYKPRIATATPLLAQIWCSDWQPLCESSYRLG